MVEDYTPFGDSLRHGSLSAKTWPPQLTDTQLEVLISNVRDWQITHGSLLKLVAIEDDITVLSHPVGVTAFPTIFPLELFNQALTLQKTYNKLYASIAEDEDWLYETLKDLIAIDPLTSALWGIHEEIKRVGPVQDLNFEIYRSDYMLHIDEASLKKTPVLKQVEFNTVSCAGGVHSNRVSAMHHYLHCSGAYQNVSQQSSAGFQASIEFSAPKNRTLETIITGLEQAHSMYVPFTQNKVCILMIVQPNNFNIADERPIEYGHWDKSIPTFRVEWGPDIFIHTHLAYDRTLHYHPPHKLQAMEVGVVYYRAGFQADEYDINGTKIRLRLEYSRAIKSPTILSHLTTFKKVQQTLALPGALERFLEPVESTLIRGTFAPMYPLDDSEAGNKGKNIAIEAETAKNHVIKPSLEGGGHNVYGADIPTYLEEIAVETWNTHILQEKIIPPKATNYLMSPKGLYHGPVISELGVFGICLWRSDKGGNSSSKNVEMVKELEPCWSFKTKNAEVDEMSVVKGYGCFDSPALVNMETFLSNI